MGDNFRIRNFHSHYFTLRIGLVLYLIFFNFLNLSNMKNETIFISRNPLRLIPPGRILRFTFQSLGTKTIVILSTPRQL